MEKSIFTVQHETLCMLLRQVREDAGLRQVDVAEKLGRPQSFVSKYETGERRLDLVELQAVCGAIGIGLVKFVALFDRNQPSR